MEQAELYDKMAEQSKTGHTYIYAEESLRLLDEIVPKKGKILDLGCGTGQIAQVLSDREWYGVDISAKSIRFAKQFYKKALVGDITTRIPFKDSTFDYVVSIHTLHHVPSKLKEALLEVRRVLKNGGQLIAVEHDSSHLGARVTHDSIFRVVYGDERTLRRDEVRQALRSTGFSEISFEPIELEARQQGAFAPFVVRAARAIPVWLALRLSKGSFSFLLRARAKKGRWTK